jgi:hypothetical protein
MQTWRAVLGGIGLVIVAAGPSTPAPPSGLREDPRLASIDGLIAQGRYDAARDRATELLVHPPFLPPKRAPLGPRWTRSCEFAR